MAYTTAKALADAIKTVLGVGANPDAGTGHFGLVGIYKRPGKADIPAIWVGNVVGLRSDGTIEERVTEGLEIVVFPTREPDTAPIYGGGFLDRGYWPIRLIQHDRTQGVTAALNELLKAFPTARNPIVLPGTDDSFEQVTVYIPDWGAYQD